MDILRQIELGDKFWAAGQPAEAAAIYEAALQKYPTDAKLRAITIRACVACRRFGTARLLCVEGLKIASNEAEFNQLLSLLKEVR
jgi:hypothetical protein